MRIFQIVTSLAFGDAVGNDALAIDRLLRENGYETGIYCRTRDERIKNPSVHLLNEMPKLSKEDVILFHYYGYSEIADDVIMLKCRVILIYHNITPPEYFRPYDYSTYRLCSDGRKQLARFAMISSDSSCRAIDAYQPYAVIADSEYNKKDLLEIGYSCPIEVCPILIPFEDYEKKPNEDIINEFARTKEEIESGTGTVNVVFVGRIAPNKRHEDIIHTFSWYKENLNMNCRLILAGGTAAASYQNSLKDYCEELGITESVIFTEKVPFADILAYYSIADVFLCMSTHEGFCVPLTEAMYFHTPIIARNASAIPDTLGDSGLLVDDNDPVTASMLIDKVIINKNFRESIIASQDRRLQDFSYENVGKQFIMTLKKLIG